MLQKALYLLFFRKIQALLASYILLIQLKNFRFFDKTKYSIYFKFFNTLSVTICLPNGIVCFLQRICRRKDDHFDRCKFIRRFSRLLHLETIQTGHLNFQLMVSLNSILYS